MTKGDKVAVSAEEARQQAFIDGECRWILGELQGTLERMALRYSKVGERHGRDEADIAKALHAGQLLGFAQWVVMQTPIPMATYDQAGRILTQLIERSGTGLEVPDSSIVVPGRGERH